MPPQIDASAHCAKPQKNCKVDSGPETGPAVPLDMPGAEVGDMNTPAASSGGGGDGMEQKRFLPDKPVGTTLVAGPSQQTP